MRRLILTITLLAAICGALRAQNTQHTLTMGDFTEMTVVNGINVIYRNLADSAGVAVFDCDPQLASCILMSNKNGKLKIELSADAPTKGLPTVTVYSMQLTNVTNWADSTITIDKLNPCAKFKAKVIGNGEIVVPELMCTRAEANVEAGNGHIYLAGKCQEAKLKIVSAGTIEASNLQANTVKCMIMGTGTVDCAPQENLNVSGLGSGHVYYVGSPKVNVKSLGVKVEKVG